jgi:hypothetical protein
MFINLGLLYMFVGLTHSHFWWHCIFKTLVLFQMAYLEALRPWHVGCWHNKIDDIIVLKMNLMMSCLAHWPNSSRWAIILEIRLVESIKQNAVPHSCQATETGRLQCFPTITLANSGSCLPAQANQMKFLWHHLLSSQTHSRPAASSPTSTHRSFGYHTQWIQNHAQYMQSRGVLDNMHNESKDLAL